MTFDEEADIPKLDSETRRKTHAVLQLRSGVPFAYIGDLRKYLLCISMKKDCRYDSII
jgi:hypothetical protein